MLFNHGTVCALWQRGCNAQHFHLSPTLLFLPPVSQTKMCTSSGQFSNVRRMRWFPSNHFRPHFLPDYIFLMLVSRQGGWTAFAEKKLSWEWRQEGLVQEERFSYPLLGLVFNFEKKAPLAFSQCFTLFVMLHASLVSRTATALASSCRSVSTQLTTRTRVGFLNVITVDWCDKSIMDINVTVAMR